MKRTSNLFGYLVLAFGAGMLTTCFLPAFLPVIIEAAIIIGTGIFRLSRR